VDFFQHLLDFILHIDKHLLEIVNEYDKLTYIILCLIIFCETGLVFTPFLPGDSLLFAAGALAAQQIGLEIGILIPLLFLSAVLGDSSNYFIGKFTGERIVSAKRSFIRKEYLEKTRVFYEKHGGKTVVLARFMPILRTFAPFVAGLGAMIYARFLRFSIIGNVIWIGLFTIAGYLFGNITWVKENFSSVILAIIAISLLPMVIAFIREKFMSTAS
jgi:membrane-associated protein